MLGLTATPRGGTSKWKTAFSKSFAELVKMKVLAQPRPEEVETLVTWSPSLNGMRDADRASLRELARSAKRNRTIVQH